MSPAVEQAAVGLVLTLNGVLACFYGPFPIGRNVNYLPTMFYGSALLCAAILS